MGTATARRRLLLVAGALVLLGAMLGGGVAAATPPRYTARAVSVVGVRSAEPLSTRAGWQEPVVDPYVSAARTPLVLGPVIRRLGLRTPPERLAEAVSVEGDAGAMLVRIAVIDASPVRAAAIADAVQERLASVVTTTRGGAASGPVGLRAVQRASVPSRPSEPSVALDLLVGALGGALAALVVLGVPATLRALRRPPSGGLAAPSML